MNAAAPGLRDIHLPPAPSWWPPAPGWWVLAAFASILLAWLCVRGLHRLRQRRRVRAVLREFDRTVAVASNPSAALASASELLRRAARLHDSSAPRMGGDEWLAYLDGTNAARPFSQGDGRVLVEGMFNRIVDPARATAALRIARGRLHELLVDAPLETSHA
jgi:hypothetical protein